MNAWMNDLKKRVVGFWALYGKVTTLGVLLFLCVMVCSFIIVHLTPRRLTVSFLDVGQGDAIFITTPHGHQMLVDGGVSDKVLEKISEQMNYFDRTIDVIVATHPDADHITGLVPVLARYEVRHVITSPVEGTTGISKVLGESILDEGADIHVAKKGDEIIFGDGVVAHILYPSKNARLKSSETNDASVVLVITYGNESVLLTGDLPTTHEDELLVGGRLPRNVTIYKAGHHGSKYSSGEQLLSYIKAEYAVISAGKDNKYGHPNPEAVDRLQTYSKEILSTIEKGTITFVMDGKSLKIKTDK